MIKTSMLSAAITAAIFITGSAIAQAPQAPQPGYQKAPPMGGPMPHHGMMKHPKFSPPPVPKPMAMPDFPTPEELSKMAPPEPMTEAKIKERFAKRKAAMTEMMERDRKAAEKYAQDYARLQKHQADTLAEIMANAEKRREDMLKRIDDMEKKVLQRFQESKAAEQKPAAAK